MTTFRFALALLLSVAVAAVPIAIAQQKASQQQAPFALPKGVKLTKVQVLTLRVGLIEGEVRNASGAGVSGLELVLQDSGRLELTRTRTDATGAFRFHAEKVGTYYLTTTAKLVTKRFKPLRIQLTADAPQGKVRLFVAGGARVSQMVEDVTDVTEVAEEQDDDSLLLWWIIGGVVVAGGVAGGTIAIVRNNQSDDPAPAGGGGAPGAVTPVN